MTGYCARRRADDIEHACAPFTPKKARTINLVEAPVLARLSSSAILKRDSAFSAAATPWLRCRLLLLEDALRRPARRRLPILLILLRHALTSDAEFWLFEEEACRRQQRVSLQRRRQRPQRARRRRRSSPVVLADTLPPRSTRLPPPLAQPPQHRPIARGVRECIDRPVDGRRALGGDLASVVGEGRHPGGV